MDHASKYVDGVLTPLSPEEIAELHARDVQNEAAAALAIQDLVTNGYKYNREKAYASLADQIDMLWHSMDSGEIPKSVAFYNSRQSVKIEFPKPTL